MQAWVLSLLGVLVAIGVALGVLRGVTVCLRRRQRDRDDVVWKSVFAQRNPRAAAGECRTTDRYDFEKAVAGRRRWLRRTASGRVWKSPQQLRREAESRRAPVERLDQFRRVRGDR